MISNRYDLAMLRPPGLEGVILLMTIFLSQIGVAGDVPPEDLIAAAKDPDPAFQARQTGFSEAVGQDGQRYKKPSSRWTSASIVSLGPE